MIQDLNHVNNFLQYTSDSTYDAKIYYINGNPLQWKFWDKDNDEDYAYTHELASIALVDSFLKVSLNHTKKCEKIVAASEARCLLNLINVEVPFFEIARDWEF